MSPPTTAQCIHHRRGMEARVPRGHWSRIQDGWNPAESKVVDRRLSNGKVPKFTTQESFMSGHSTLGSSPLAAVIRRRSESTEASGRCRGPDLRRIRRHNQAVPGSESSWHSEDSRKGGMESVRRDIMDSQDKTWRRFPRLLFLGDGRRSSHDVKGPGKKDRGEKLELEKRRRLPMRKVLANCSPNITKSPPRMLL